MSHDDTKQEVDPTEGAWCVKWEKKHSQYKWSHFSDHLGENEGTHLSPKMKKKKKRTHGKYMACKKMNHCYHLHTVQHKYNTTWANQTPNYQGAQMKQL